MKTWFKFFKDTISGDSIQNILADRKNGDKSVVLFVYLLERLCDKDADSVELTFTQTSRRLWTTSGRIRVCLELICEHIEDASVEFDPGSFRFTLPNYVERQAHGDKRREDKEKNKRREDKIVFPDLPGLSDPRSLDPERVPLEPKPESAVADPVAPKPENLETPKSKKKDPELVAQNGELQRFWMNAYAEKRGFRYTVSSYKKFGALTRVFLQTHGLARAKELIGWYLDWKRPFIADSGWEFSLLVQYVNALVAEKQDPETVISARALQNAAVGKKTRSIAHEHDMAAITTFAQNNPPKLAAIGGPKT